jgi:hypothetical protein
MCVTIGRECLHFPCAIYMQTHEEHNILDYIFSVVLYGCKIYSLTLADKQALRVNNITLRVNNINLR